MAAELKALIKKRGVQKTKFTKNEKYFLELNHDKLNLNEIQIKKEKMDEAKADFFAIQEEILSKCEDVDNDKESQEFVLIDDRADVVDLIFAEVMEKLGVFLFSRPEHKPETPLTNNPVIPVQKKTVKLPEVKLPTFNGKYDEFLDFKKQFEVLVKNDTSMSDEMKFIYLRNCLRDDAKNIECQEENFETLWKALEDTYENKRYVVFRHITDLMAMKPMQRNSGTDLREIINNTKKHIRSFKALGFDLDELSEVFVIHIVTEKLDYHIRNDFDLSLEPRELPTWEIFVSYLEKRANTMESIDAAKKMKNTPVAEKTVSKKLTTSKVFSAIDYKKNDNVSTKIKSNLKCFFCQGNHYLSYCDEFRKLKVEDRLGKVSALEICKNCLVKGHKAEDCSRSSCLLCSGKHHTLLHCDKKNASQNDRDERKVVAINTVNKHVLLGSALIYVYDNSGNRHLVRCVIDNGAMSNLISEHLAQLLKLNRRKSNVSLDLVEGCTVDVKQKVTALIKSRHTNYNRRLDFLVMKSVTADLPINKIELEKCDLPKGTRLADETFNVPSKIDILLGMEVYHELFKPGMKKVLICNGLLAVQMSELGHVVSGVLESDSLKSSILCHVVTNDDLHKELQKFWEFDKPSSARIWSLDDRKTEKHFVENVYRNKDGRYGVRLPFNESFISEFGNSKDNAIKRFLNLERRFEKNAELRSEYQKFMDQYKELDHMHLYLENVDLLKESDYYMIPHHAVLKPSSTTTKLRVVFDGSAKTSKGLSLNLVTRKGPVVQKDYLIILLQFRFYRFVFSCDQVKMYRQIRMHPDDRKYQMILWRENPDDPIQVYKLNTVTYGTNCSSYLATRSLNQLAIDHGEKYPKAAQVVENSFYIDDCLTGATTVQELIEIKRQLVGLLDCGKFELHKWCSNVTELLKNVPEDKRELKKEVNQSSIKALGIEWDPKRDKFIFKFKSTSFADKLITKRSVLSDLATFYDPLGIVEPLKFYAKVFMQELWQKPYDWDTELSESDQKKWKAFCEGMRNMKPIEIDRFAWTENTGNQMEIHGFSDASELGYGACIYVRSINKKGNVKMVLLCSRSRVAPISTLTIPRLELMGAHLLAELVSMVERSIPKGIEFRKFFWTDSKIVLAWIQTVAKNLKTFVAHRVAEIQELTNISDWRYVPTEDNPADIVSRGLSPENFIYSDLWFQGAKFLSELNCEWENKRDDFDVLIPDMKSTVLTVITTEPCELFDRYSDFTTLSRITAWIKRFCQNLRDKVDKKPLNLGNITVNELKNAEYALIKLVQSEYYQKEIDDLGNDRPLNRKSNLLNLSPFLDGNGILRVGGRLTNALVAYDQKHPIILPPYHNFTVLLIRKCHDENLHAGTQAVLCFLRRKYWIIHGRNAVKRQVKFCVKCFRQKPIIAEQLMGDLPIARVRPSFPFMTTYLDYCGYFWLKANPRGTIKTKGYVCVFRCPAIGGIHLELASDLSTEAFINALYRFVARRGEVSDIHSDNGTNFRGAVPILEELYNLFKDQDSNQKIMAWCKMKNVNWHFIPPGSPHMGGTWEASVKLAKTLMKKVMGNSLLTYEEFSTVLCRIESVLNSRPITKMNDDPTDLTALTPGHFLIGRPLNELVEPDMHDFKAGKWSRFVHLTKLKQDFWKQWVSGYLNQLQMRYKWHSKVEVSEGQIVIVKDENLPATRWLLGRIVKLHPGKDDVVRVVTVLTQAGETTRPLAKLCFLPIKDNDSLSELDQAHV